jgi:hypothetical protein
VTVVGVVSAITVTENLRRPRRILMDNAKTRRCAPEAYRITIPIVLAGYPRPAKPFTRGWQEDAAPPRSIAIAKHPGRKHSVRAKLGAKSVLASKKYGKIGLHLPVKLEEKR